MNKYLAGGGANDYNWSIQIDANMDAGTVNSGHLNSGSLPLITDAWVELRIEIDLNNGTASEYYNNQLLGTANHAWHEGTGLNVLDAIDLYANGAAPVYYDNLTLTMIPEPGSLALLVLGGSGAGLRRRRPR